MGLVLTNTASNAFNAFSIAEAIHLARNKEEEYELGSEDNKSIN